MESNNTTAQKVYYQMKDSFKDDKKLIYEKKSEIDLALSIIKKVCQISNIVGADINELAPIKNFDSYNFLVAKLAYKILAYTFEFKN